MRFTHVTLAQRVLFGSGKAAVNLAAETARVGAQRIMVITSGSHVALARAVTSRINVHQWHEGTPMHVPIGVADRVSATVKEKDIELLISIGGGSATGLAKAAARATSIPIVSVPTTYAGSEATNVWGLTDRGLKTTGIDDRVLPVAVIYDAQLTTSLPVDISIASGLNAIAHSIDSFWAPGTNPINQTLAEEGIRALSIGLPLLTRDPNDLAGREYALYGAYLSAVAFASAGSGMHHKICHVLGGSFDLPHAQTHAIMLPYVLAFNTRAAPEAQSRIAAALGAATALRGVQRLRDHLEAPRTLGDYGFTAARIPRAVKLSLTAIPAGNPQEVTPEGLTALFHAALTGAAPETLCN